MSLARSLGILLTLILVSCRPAPYPTPTAQSVPTRLPEAVPTIVTTAMATPRLSVFQASEGCPPGVSYEVSYDADQWLFADDRLSSRQQVGCALWLIPHGTMVSGPMQPGAVSLGGQDWELRHFPSEGLISYLPRSSEACYFFIVYYPFGESEEVVASCQHAAEAVIDSFQLRESD